jgi:hypothetical protein
MSLDVFLEVKTCSKALSAVALGHGKSPCFLQVNFLHLSSPDYRLLVLPCIDGAESVECAV